MTYNDAMAYLAAAEVYGSKLGLDGITRLMELLGNPQDRLNCVHVAGTNGKGSVSAFIGSILTEAGYKTGVFTSPHIERFEERFVIGGSEISREEVAAVCEAVRSRADIMIAEGFPPPTHFELVTAMALLYFYEKQCSFAVLEVGLGGRLDATNVIKAPACAVITAIDYDHTEVLGETLAEIAFEKAGIIKSGCAVASYPQPPDAMRVIGRVCADMGAELHTVAFNEYGALDISLLGEHQQKNAALAVKAAETLRGKGFAIPESAVKRGLLNAARAGRFEVLCKQPPVIIDGAHNPHGARALADALKKYYGSRKTLFIMGVLADKDYMGMLKAVLPLAARVFTVSPDSRRALAANELAEIIRGKNVPSESFNTVSAALCTALSNVAENEAVCCFGSLYFIGEARTLLTKPSIGEVRTLLTKPSIGEVRTPLNITSEEDWNV